jgi:hypothetical protein
MGGFIERQSERYNAAPGDSGFDHKALSQRRAATLAELTSNFAFFDSYMSLSSHALAGYIGLTRHSSASTRALPTLNANSQPWARPVALLATRTSPLVSGTMSLEQYARCQSSKRSAKNASAGRS